MNSLKSIIKKLAPLNLYNLNNSNIMDELSSYCTGIDKIFSELEEMEREAFIQTSQTYGILTKEKIYDSGHQEKNIEQRRKLLIDRMTIGVNDFTYDGIKRYITSLGVEFILNEIPAQGIIIVEVTTPNLSEDTKNYIKKSILHILPAHHIAQVYFGGCTWEQLDNFDITFEEAEDKNLTWKAIDNLTYQGG